MPNYRRIRVPGATYFFTVVTYRRHPILASPEAMQTLRASLAVVRRALPFVIDAWVVLPDHMHAIWTLPEGDADYSRRWGRIKAEFTRRYRNEHASSIGRGARLWQPRFWEHMIRNDHDRTVHADYLHFNPVKHGLTSRVSDWPYSTFHRCVRDGIYAPDWGQSEPTTPVVDLGE